MAIARVQMPDGRIGRFEVPEGTTPEQAEQLASQSMPKPQKMGTLASAASRAKEYGYGTAQALGAELSPETLAGLKHERSRQSFGGQAATDFALGIPMQIGAAAIPVTGGPVGSGAVSGGLQAGMLPVQPDESRAGNVARGTAEGAFGGKVGQLVTKAVAPVVRPAISSLGRLATKATGAVESVLPDAVTDAVNKATTKFGFRLLPGQKTGVTNLRERETGYRAGTSPRMTSVQGENQQKFNNFLAKQMGVPEAKQITRQTDELAVKRVKTIEDKAYNGKTLLLDTRQNGTFTTAIRGALQNVSQPVQDIFGPRAASILTKAQQLSQMSGDEFKWLRSELQGRMSAEFNSTAAGSRDRALALKAVSDALDQELELTAQRATRLPNGSFAHGTFTPDDLKLAQQARQRWKGILTVRESKRGEFDIDPNKWATKAKDWYSANRASDADALDLIDVIDNVPDFKASVGTPDTIRPKGGAPFVSATVGPSGVNMRAGEGVGGMFAGALEGPYMGAARLNYYTPAEIKRRALAQALGLTTSVGGREVNDYVTRR